MKIILTGAPGAGKSKLAKTLATKLHHQWSEEIAVVDGYVNKLTKRTGFAYGPWATYPQNYQVQCARWTEEQALEHKGSPHLIVVGSVYDSILYTAIRVNKDLEFNESNEATVHMYGRAAMGMLGAFEALTADHDLLFFLPLDEKTLATKGRSYDLVLNDKLPEVIEAHLKPLIRLNGTQKEKLTNANSQANAYRDRQTELTQTDSNGVAQSSELLASDISSA